MVRSLAPPQAAALLQEKDLQLIDVREPHEWAEGHLPGSRNVPLSAFKQSPRAHATPGRLLLVCARGMRSLSAAEAAVEAGLGEVYSLEGGTLAWEKAGLMLERPFQATASVPTSPVEEEGAPAEGCSLPEPGLDAVVGANLKALRAQRELSLDALAGLTGLSRSLLGQVELGRASPSVSVVWKIATAFGVPFSAMLKSAAPLQAQVIRAEEAKRLVSPDGRFSSRALYPLGQDTHAEFYELYLAPHSTEEAQPHAPGTRENLVVTSGRLELKVGAQTFHLGKGDAILFGAEVAHSYHNPSAEDCWMYLVMTYAQ